MLRELDAQNLPLVTIEEGQLRGGMGSEIARICIERGLRIPGLMMGIGDHFVTHGAMPLILKDCGLMPDQIAERIKTFLAGNVQEQVSSKPVQDAGQADALADGSKASDSDAGK